MYDFALNAHSGLRYLILLVAIITAVYALIGMARKTPVDKTGLTMLRVFAVLLDIQVVLGIITIITGRFYAQLMGHLVMMIAAVAVAHLGVAKLRKADPATRGHGMLLASSLIPLALIIAGIVAIGRAVV